MYRHFDLRLGWRSGVKVYHHFDPRLGDCIWGEPAVCIAGQLGRKSRCEPFEAAIGSKMESGLSAQRIYQDLVEEKGFGDSY